MNPKDVAETQVTAYVEEWGLFLDHDCGSKDCAHYQHYLEAKAALLQLLHDREAEARIDELTRLNTRRHYGKDYQDSLDELDEYKDQRLAQLKPNKEASK